MFQQIQTDGQYFINIYGDVRFFIMGRMLLFKYFENCKLYINDKQFWAKDYFERQVVPIKLIILMSIQKLKIFKKLKGSQNYSKNPIFDSLIKQKLQSQMIIIKDNFNQVVQRQQGRYHQIQQQKSLKRRLSTHNLASLTSQKIKNSLIFHPVKNKQVLEFVIDRQKASPFFERSQIDNINTARTYHEDLLNKIKENTKVNYQSIGTTVKDDQFISNLSGKVKKMMPSDIWLPDDPYVQEVTQAMADRSFQSPLKQSNTIKNNSARRPSSQSLQVLKGQRAKAPKQNDEKKNGNSQITYQHSKFHKNDYISLQKWFQQALQRINRKNNELKSSSNLQQQKIRYYLNESYSIYMASLKQLIRLTYIESAQKALLMQKIIWSLVRLFKQLIQEQHKINYSQFKESSKENQQLRILYQSRIKNLERLASTKQKEALQLSQLKSKISLSLLTYKRVNQQMNHQIEQLQSQILSLHKQNGFLMNNIRKLITQFEQRDIIKIQKQQNYNLYYYLNQKNEIQVVAKVPRQQLLQRFFQSSVKPAGIHNLEQNLLKEGHKLDKLENQLAVYWQKKKNYLEIDQLVQSLYNQGVSDYGAQIDQHGPNELVEFGQQFPEEDQESFADFLKRQLQEQRQSWTKKQTELTKNSISLKQIYDEARQSIKLLTTQNISLKQAIDQKDHEISYFKRKSEQVDEKASLLQKKITMMEKQLEEHKLYQSKLQIQIDNGLQKLAQEKKKHLFEKQNSKILASSNFQLKEKLEASQKQFNNLQEKIRTLSPYFQQTMTLAQSSQNSTLLKLSQMLQLHLSQYVQKDAKVFLTH